MGDFGAPKNDMRDPVISPDGTKVALDSAGAKWEIWVQDSIRNTATHLAGTLYGVGFPEWLDHGKSIAFGCQVSATSEANVCVSPADGSGQPQSVLNFGPGVGAAFSPDQRTILFAKENEGGNFDIWSARFQIGAKPEPFIATQFNELAPRISPDGRNSWCEFVELSGDERFGLCAYLEARTPDIKIATLVFLCEQDHLLIWRETHANPRSKVENRLRLTATISGAYTETLASEVAET